MTYLLRALCFLVLLGLAVGPSPAADDKEIARLIAQLGDDDEDVRKAAEKKLLEIGNPAMEQIRQAAKTALDGDVRLRAMALEKNIVKAKYKEIRQYPGHAHWIRSVAVSKDGKKLLTGSQDRTMRLWDVESGKELLKVTIAPDSWAWEVAFSPDESRAIASGGIDKTLRLYSLEDGKELRKYEGHASNRVYGAAFSPDGKYVLSSGAEKEEVIRLYETDTGKEVRKLAGHTGWVWRAYFSPDGKKVASAGCQDYSFRVWDAETGKPLVIGDDAHDGWVMDVAFSPDGTKLLTCGRDQTCKLWDAAKGKLLKTYTGLAGDPECVAFSPDGKRFLVGENKIVYVFDTESGKIVHRFEDHHPGKVFAVAWLPDGARAVSAGADNVARLWPVPK